jgi:hypothetical protein
VSADDVGQAIRTLAVRIEILRTEFHLLSGRVSALEIARNGDIDALGETLAEVQEQVAELETSIAVGMETFSSRVRRLEKILEAPPLPRRFLSMGPGHE